ncbi:MAG: hypothetical protein IKO16_08105 [Lachnospiraceae bacterium]|nr:hypothetical protein [Lachnospiraceae bacterium]
METKKFAKTKRLVPTAICAADDSLYAISRESPLIYRIDVDTGTADAISYLSHGNESFENLCFMIIHSDTRLFFLPGNRTDLTIYDIASGETESISLKGIIERGHINFCCGCVIDVFLYLFGYEIDKIVKVDLGAKTCTEITYDTGDIDIVGGLLARDYVYFNGNIFVTLLKNNRILCLNTADDSVSFVELGAAEKGFSSIIHRNENFWLIPYEGRNVCRYCLDDGNMTMFDCKSTGRSWYYSGGVDLDEEIYILPAYADRIVALSMDNGTCVEVSKAIKELERLIPSSFDFFCCSNPIVCRRKIYSYMSSIDKLFCFDPEDDIVDLKEIFLNSYNQDVMRSCVYECGIFDEGEIGINEFLESI